MKECFKCNKVKALDQFYKHPRMADGHVNKCKECNKVDVRDNYAKRREQYSEYDKARNNESLRRLKKLEYAKRSKEKNPLKAIARQKVGNAVRDGRLIKLPCQFCGEPKSQAHHDDYSKPLDVVWACFKCHREKCHGQTVTQKDYVQ